MSEPTTRLARIANFTGRYAFAAGAMLYTFTLGLLSPRRRYLISRIARDARYPETPRTRLPLADISAVTREATPVVLPRPQAAEGNVDLLELVVLARLVRERQARSIFEIGTFNGRTTLALAANSPADTVVHTLDLPPTQPPALAVVAKEQVFVDKPYAGELITGSPWAEKIRQFYGDSATFDFSTVHADFIFVDGSHAYQYVRNDSERAFEMLRGGQGTIVWHDYGEWEGVTRALNDLRASDPRFAGLRQIRGTSLALLTL